MLLAVKIFKGALALVALSCCLIVTVLVFVDRTIPTALQPSTVAPASYVIRGASVLTMERELANEGWTVVVENGLISAVGPEDSTAIPEGAQMIDGRGKTLLPGLIDMHVHIYDEAELAAFLSHGVTTVRNAGGMPFHLALQGRLEAGTIFGPSILTSGPIINERGGRNTSINQLLVDGPVQARAAVRRIHEQGYGAIKVYSNLGLDSYAAILEEAQSLEMPVFGHPVEGKPPADQPMQRASFDLLLDDELVNLEHMESIVWHALDQRMDVDRARLLAKKISAAGLAVDPTLTVHHNLAELTRTKGAHLYRDEMEMFNPLALWFDRASYDFWANYERDNEIQLAEFYLKCVKIFHEEGVVLTVGSDSGAMVTPPGSSLTRELELFVRAGLTPWEALESATVHPSKLLGIDDKIGRIRLGYKADLILVDGNPLDDVSVVEHPSGVMHNGVWSDQEKLTELHEAGKQPSLIRTLRHVLGLLIQLELTYRNI